MQAFPISHGVECKLWPATPAGSAGLNLVENSKDGSKDSSDPQRTLESIAQPSIRAFLSKSPNGAAVIITVGGGCTSLVIDKERIRKLPMPGLPFRKTSKSQP